MTLASSHTATTLVRLRSSACCIVGSDSALPWRSGAMAYNLYQVQMARAWAERIEKENAQQEKFWHSQTMKSVGSKPSSPSLPAPPPVGAPGDLYFDALESRSVAGMSAARSAAPTGFTSKTSYLKSRLEKLEGDLQAERESRKRVEEDLASLRNSMRR